MIDAILAVTRLGFPADLLIKATLVLTVAAGVTLLMSRASAASRHLVWAVGIAALLSLPLLALVVPRWEVPLERVEGISATPSSVDPVLPGETDTRSMAGEAVETPFAGIPTGAQAPTPPVAEDPVIEAGAGSRVNWLFAAFGAWALGVLLLAIRQVVGWVGTHRLARSAERIEDPEWLGLLRDASWLLDVDREVLLLRGGASSMPITWGTRRPAILIPAEADSWPLDRRRVVLLHEMAHVARRDCLIQTITDFTCALYWFHPLAWIAARAMRRERERACDDLVLAAGERASDYAGHLLEVARSYRGHPVYSSAAIAMARPSQLEGRLLAVLDAARPRGAPGRREIVGALAMAAIILVPLAAIRTVEAQGGSGEGKESTLLQQLQTAIDGPAESSTLPVAGGLLSVGRADQGAVADTVVVRSIEARPGGTVVLDVENGANLVITGWDNEEVELRAELRGRSANETHVELTSRNGEIRLLSEYTGGGRNNGGNHTFEVMVPIFSNLEIENGGGNVTLEGISGTFTGGTGGGALTLDRLAGRADLRTGGGNVRVTNSRLDGEVTTGGGNVVVSGNEGDLRGTTGGGNVRIENSGPTGTAQSNRPTRIHTGGGNIDLLDVRGEADLATGGGDISVQSVGGSLTAATGAGDIRIGRAASSVTARSGAGDIALASVAGSAQARTGNGDIRLTLAPSAAVRDIDLDSGSGDVTLEVPADFAGSFDITINSRRPRSEQIRSDIPLTTEVQGGSNGVVRATGRTGAGGSRVTIETSSGNVTIRRAGTAASVTRGPVPAGDSVSEPAREPAIRLDVAIEEAFEEAFDEDFERNIENLVNTSLTSLSSGLAQFTTSVTTAALAEAVAALERADRVGGLDENDREELDELRAELRKLEAQVR